MEEKLTSLAQGEYKETNGSTHLYQRYRCHSGNALIVATGRFTYFDNAKQHPLFGLVSPCPPTIRRQSMSRSSTETGIQASQLTIATPLLGSNTECKGLFDRYSLTAKRQVAVSRSWQNSGKHCQWSHGKPYVDGLNQKSHNSSCMVGTPC